MILPMDKDEIKLYRPTLDPETRDLLNDLADKLGYRVINPGRHFGQPSPPQLLDALAAAYRADPAAVAAALAALLGQETAVPPASTKTP